MPRPASTKPDRAIEMASPFPLFGRGAVEVVAQAAVGNGIAAARAGSFSPGLSQPPYLHLLEFEQFDRWVAGEQPSLTGRPNELSLGQFGQ